MTTLLAINESAQEELFPSDINTEFDQIFKNSGENHEQSIVESIANTDHQNDFEIRPMDSKLLNPESEFEIYFKNKLTDRQLNNEKFVDSVYIERKQRVYESIVYFQAKLKFVLSDSYEK